MVRAALQDVDVGDDADHLAALVDDRHSADEVFVAWSLPCAITRPLASRRDHARSRSPCTSASAAQALSRGQLTATG
jgi:hypothetical protein